MPSVLFCDPKHFQVIDSKNPFMKPGEPVDLPLACEQWESLKREFADAGFSIEVLPSVEGLEDMVYCNNQLFVAEQEKGRFMVPSGMRFAARESNVPHYGAWLQQRGYRV